MSTLQLLAVLIMAYVYQETSAFYPKYFGHQFRGQLPRCSSASKPCRVKAVLQSNDPEESDSPEVIGAHLCSCAERSSCSTDWEGDIDRVISRELRTNGIINMTFHMMFCNPLLHPGWCSSGDVTLQLKGMSIVPLEVDFINCSCLDPRPLVLDRTFIGDDYQNHHAFVCPNHKRRCNLLWNPDKCLVQDPETNTVHYPCKCTNSTVCRSESNDDFADDYFCLQPNVEDQREF